MCESGQKGEGERNRDTQRQRYTQESYRATKNTYLWAFLVCALPSQMCPLLKEVRPRGQESCVLVGGRN